MFSKKIGIDLGTSFTRLVSSEKTDPKVIRNILIVNPLNEEIVYMGDSAFDIYGKESPELEIVRPVKNGILQESIFQKELLELPVRELIGRNRFIRPEFVVSIPLRLRESDRNSVTNLLEELGAKSGSVLIPEIILSAVGLRLPINKSSGIAVVNLGAGTTETAVMSLGGVVIGDSFQFGGEDLDSLIVDNFRLSNIEIGKKTAEFLKIQFGSAEVINNSSVAEVKGKDITTGKIINYEFKTDSIRAAITPGLEKIAESIKKVLEKLPPELASDIIDNGIALTGGTANLRNLNFYLSNYLNVPVYRLDNPSNSCIQGISYIINNSEILNKNFYLK